MGKASREKARKRESRRDRPRLLKKLSEQVELLAVLGQLFDSGSRVASFPMATAIRVLVHNTQRSHALLAQLDELDRVTLLDTSLPISPSNLLPHNGLALMKVTSGVGAEWVPRLEVDSPPSGAEPRLVPFGSWWQAPVIKDGSGVLWNRRRIVLTIANQEGGAHIDPTQPVDVRALEDENSMGWSYNDPINGDIPMATGPLMPSIRQIAFELERSVSARFGHELDNPS